MIDLTLGGNTDVAASATEALGVVGGVKAESQLMSLLPSAPDYVRCPAVCALGRVGSARAVAALVLECKDQ